MANTFQTLINSAISYANDDKIKLDEDKAAAISNTLGKISSEIEMAATQIEGPISETQPIWTGQAAENFFSEIGKLISETREISEKIRQNRQQLDNAVSIIMAAENEVRKDTNDLPAGNVFIN
ncbi:MAG: WXG100 family type VII secretion target [Lachnospiraceae bacterium]|nr:WXG100 family type VII secretion target [Lachnospiraceae bacterium]